MSRFTLQFGRCQCLYVTEVGVVFCVSGHKYVRYGECQVGRESDFSQSQCCLLTYYSVHGVQCLGYAFVCRKPPLQTHLTLSRDLLLKGLSDS